MTMTLNIPEDVLERLMRNTGARTPEDAIMQLVTEYARPRSQKDLIPLMGKSETFMSPEELEAMRGDED